ncbi:GlsB/YeaQ/YmgE family stress response membrane protein [Allopontixanthobacter sp.]|uniref:GlsB/YeaQ/YmgE family stress response membrane protein n=1 Tax=Allopontixanthobacter sp. TaxID=2906452 RepID=UPI002ABCC26F|nr:GlsB/YeaQ/YmgE family stress response membrane protein [Allopontixanthobacter sp.]MDZ4308387.1 GlsB/YeaQ/YmgE family stress response membrane protein [Allopontixanthobacter sp.]
MGLVILIALGALLGWLASIITRVEDQQGIVYNLAAGVGGALISGLFIGDSMILTGISAGTVLAGFAGSVVVLALCNVVLKDAFH